MDTTGNLVRHYAEQALRTLSAMEAAYSEEARHTLLRTAKRFLQEIERLVSNPS